ncbi:MAG: hypothetical protein EAZ07_06985 [Cytophagales bacterium]|nr:MAG: hypothetical protein EAZ07_06985 [Cytophagales bacterium]
MKNLIKIIEISTPIFTAIFGALYALMKTSFTQSYKNKERENLVNILKETDALKIDSEFKDILIDEYKNLVIRDLRGIDIPFKKYIAILESGLLDKYSNSQIRISNRFFEYSGKKLNVRIPRFYKVIAILNFVLSIIFIALGLALFLYTINSDNDYDLLRYFSLAGFSLLTLIFGFFMIDSFVAPINVARLIKKDLDNA